MSRSTKIWLITAASLVLTGCIILGVAMSLLKWDLRNLSTNKYETNTYDINEDFKSISIDTNTADIVFVATENVTASVVCYEQKNIKHSVTVNDGTLVIKVVDTRQWYEHIGISFRSPKITVSLPKAEYAALTVKGNTGKIEASGDLRFKNIDITLTTGDINVAASVSEHIKIKGSTGRVTLESIKAKSLDISVSTGNVSVKDSEFSEDIKVRVSTGDTHLTSISCKNFISHGNTGDITLDSLIASDKIFIERSTGDVKLNRCDALTLDIGTDTGDITGHLLSGKIFMAESDTGDVKVPMPSGENICKITSDTGDIRFTVE